MVLNRIIPVILIKNSQCIKTYKYKKPVYIGDPINIVKIFNEKEVDELIILDIDTKQPKFELIESIVSEAFIPVSYGGGIKNIEDARKLFSIGIEKIVVNSFILNNPNFIKELVSIFGSASIIVSADIKKNIFGKYKIQKYNALEWLKKCEYLGAGELFITNIEKEGTMNGYDIDFLKIISSNINIPIIANGGAGTLSDIKELFTQTKITAAAAGSMFVFKGIHRAILINYPTSQKEVLYASL